MMNFTAQELMPDQITFKTLPDSINDLIFWGSLNIGRLISYHRNTEKRLRDKLNNPEYNRDITTLEDLDRVRLYIKVLIKMRRQVDKKPVFPMLRTAHHFSDGDLVTCFIGVWQHTADRKIVAYDWMTGKIVGEPSYIATRITLCLDAPVHANTHFFNGAGMTLFVVDPCLMHNWEFTYLKANLDYFKLWANNHEDYAPAYRRMLTSLESNLDIPGMKQ